MEVLPLTTILLLYIRRDTSSVRIVHWVLKLLQLEGVTGIHTMTMRIFNPVADKAILIIELFLKHNCYLVSEVCHDLLDRLRAHQQASPFDFILAEFFGKTGV